jgi:probable phosphoglycerate mutase
MAGYDSVAQIEPALGEWNYGEYEGHTTSEIRDRAPDWSLWEHGVPKGETIQQVAERARAVMSRCLSVEGDVALFAHGHILRILAACWLDLSPQAGRFFALSPGAVSILGFERETRVIRMWNCPVEER